VGEHFNFLSCKKLVYQYFLYVLTCVSDIANIDKCAVNNGNCSEFANCTNFEGGHNCTCYPGYTGDGFTCTGVFLFM